LTIYTRIHAGDKGVKERRNKTARAELEFPSILKGTLEKDK